MQLDRQAPCRHFAVAEVVVVCALERPLRHFDFDCVATRQRSLDASREERRSSWDAAGVEEGFGQGRRPVGPQSGRLWASAWGPKTGAGRGGAYLAVALERAAEDLRRAASVAEEWP